MNRSLAIAAPALLFVLAQGAGAVPIFDKYRFQPFDTATLEALDAAADDPYIVRGFAFRSPFAATDNYGAPIENPPTPFRDFTTLRPWWDASSTGRMPSFLEFEIPGEAKPSSDSTESIWLRAAGLAK